ncbi:type IV secretory system conjugative DNA transfer family protein [Trinickia acidisoli]|uniref:type IV secretory system conjugative DNA transfer family protein n=1 Tax=Trinickia acidisoli TaxID=2767482 RepID=UPI001F5CB48E|nr:type IV secretory system conjugative DNA transfer family protein [Trinickia acidisoli]
MRTLLKIVACAIGTLVVVAPAGLWLAGAIYMLESKLPIRGSSVVSWYEYWYWYRGDPIQASHLYAALGKAVFIVIILIFFLILAVTRRRRSLYGDARFANRSEIHRSGLLGTHGVIVGKYGDRYLTLGGQQFVIVAAPTRSGKGVGIVVPNLLNFPDSVVVLDIKQENFNITAGYRAAHGQPVFLFNPFASDGRTHRYNPLTYISDDPHLRIRDILTIGTILFPPEGKDGSGKDAFWYDAARNLFLGLTLLVCETPELPRTMGEVMRQASGYGRKLPDHLNAVIQGRWAQGRPLSSSCVDALYRVLDNAEITFASIVSTFNTALTNWANPIFDAATSESDFLLTDVRRRRMSIYLGITPDHLPDSAALINVFFSQLVNLNLRELPQANPELRYQCLLMMDEFTSMGKVNIIAKAIGFMAGYNMRLMPIIQSVSQLTAVYGQQDARTLMTNHALQVIFAPREQQDANEYSEMLGYVTQKNTSISRPAGFSFQKQASRNDTTSDQRRALMLPQELKELGQDREIIMLENTKPILAEKIRYFMDPVFKQRVRAAPSISSVSMQAHEAVVANCRALMAQYVFNQPAPQPQTEPNNNAGGEAPVAVSPQPTPQNAPVQGGG